MKQPPIDLRSDTVTRPSDAMRAAIAAAPVGDDQYGEDPTTNLLQERIADILGKEAALFFPSGTMANQVAVRVLTRPGDDVIASRESHLGWHETGGAAANSGVQITEIGDRGVFTADELLAARKIQGRILCIRRRRWSRSRTRRTGWAGSSSRRTRWSGSAPPRARTTWRHTSTGRGCGMQRSRRSGPLPSWPRHSSSRRSRFPGDSAHRADRCSPGRRTPSRAARVTGG